MPEPGAQSATGDEGEDPPGVIIGSAEIVGDALRTRVDECCREFVSFRIREHQDPEAALRTGAGSSNPDGADDGAAEDAPEVHALLLADLENQEARVPEGQRFDVSALRRELGLEG